MAKSHTPKGHSQWQERHRSAITGHFVKEWVARKYPHTTVTERYKR